MPELTPAVLADLSAMFEDLIRCCLHDPQWRPADVQRVIRWEGDRAADNDSKTILLAYLKGNYYGLLTQSADFTGHGCQCDSMTVKETGLHRLLTHLSDFELLELIEQ